MGIVGHEDLNRLLNMIDPKSFGGRPEHGIIFTFSATFSSIVLWCHSLSIRFFWLFCILFLFGIWNFCSNNDRSIDWSIDRLIDWLIVDWLIVWLIDCRLFDWLIDCWLIDCLIGRLVDCLIDWLIDWSIDCGLITWIEGICFLCRVHWTWAARYAPRRTGQTSALLCAARSLRRAGSSAYRGSHLFLWGVRRASAERSTAPVHWDQAIGLAVVGRGEKDQRISLSTERTGKVLSYFLFKFKGEK